MRIEHEYSKMLNDYVIKVIGKPSLPHYYLWLDDVRPYPFTDTSSPYGIAHSVNEAKHLIERVEKDMKDTDFYFVLDLDHDLGDYASEGGDGYKLVEWLIETGRNNDKYEIRCHSANPVGREHILGLYRRYWKPFNEEGFFNG